MAKRQASDFTLSFLDLLSGALGALVLLFVIISSLVGFDSEHVNIARVYTDAQLQIVERIRTQTGGIASLLGGSSRISGDNREQLIGLARQSLTEVDAIENEMTKFQSLIDESEAERSRLENLISGAEAQIEAEGDRCQSLVEALEETQYILVMLYWTGQGDLDLMVEDPLGNKFDPKAQPTLEGVPGRLSLDARQPGVEVFEATDFRELDENLTLTYKVYVLNPQGTPLDAKVSLFTSTGTQVRDISSSGASNRRSHGPPVFSIELARVAGECE